MAEFQRAEFVRTLYQINGKDYEKVKMAEGTQRADAIRAKLPGKDGKIAFFVPFVAKGGA